MRPAAGRPTPIEHRERWMKIGLVGFAGSGKTTVFNTTSVLLESMAILSD